MIKLTKTSLAAILVAIILNACYPGDSIPIDDLDTASTFYKPENFSTPPASAAIIWDVVQVKNDDANDLPYNGEIDDEILNTALDNLVALYGVSNVYIISESATPNPTPSNGSVTVLVPDTDTEPDVDVVVSPSIILRRETVGYVYPGYPWWGGGWWGGGWWGPGYPCYYCGYPPTVSFQQYDVGSVVLDMLDLRELVGGALDPDDLPIIWVSIDRGLVSSNSSFNGDRTVGLINQSFEQSPYLK